MLVCSLGTSGTLFGVSNTPVIDPSGTVAPFCDCTGRWLPLLCTQNCTLVPEEIRSMYTDADNRPQFTQDEMTALAAQEPGCEGLTILPYFMGERTPNWPHASGGCVGLRPGMLGRPGLLYRAALEGATFSLLAGYQTMLSYGVEAQQLLLVGGGSANVLWRQIIADAFGMPVELPPEEESAALGGALQAAAVAAGVDDIAVFVGDVCTGEGEVGVVFPCDPCARDALMEAFARHQKYGSDLFSSHV